MFINYSDNSRLDSLGFSPFGQVVSGLEVAEAAMNPTPGERGGVGQGLLEDRGNGWIRSGRWGGGCSSEPLLSGPPTLGSTSSHRPE